MEVLLPRLSGATAAAAAAPVPRLHPRDAGRSGQRGDKDSVNPRPTIPLGDAVIAFPATQAVVGRSLRCARSHVVTLNQLKVFVLVVRLGSMRAAASALGVSEPAVSQALGALRERLGDPLIERTNGSISLTPAGQRVVGLASQMVNLAVATEEAVRAAQGAPDLLRVVASADVGDAVAPALLQAFNRRAAKVEATLGIATHARDGECCCPSGSPMSPSARRWPGRSRPGVVSEPLLRYRMLLIAGNDHPLHAARRGVGASTAQ